jgi:6-phosphogluconolactonase (cycloisomerase 2 family)
LGQIDSFIIDSSTGIPTPMGVYTAGNDQQLTIDPTGEYLYSTDDNGLGHIWAYSIGTEGKLAPVPGSPFEVRNSGTSADPIGIVDTGTFVYTALSNAGSIAGFSVDSQTGALLTLVTSAALPAGITPTYLALAGNYLYVLGLNGQNDGFIYGYSINATTGKLTSVTGSPFGSEGMTLTTDVTGQYVYLSTFDGIQGYAVNSTNGYLTPISPNGFAGNDGWVWMAVTQLAAQ